MKNIRNFCIIAHIDHGKSTLADRLIERARIVDERKFQNQLLDEMEIERERGISIKSHAITIPFEKYSLNLVDTPGHVDFTYEVSRAIASCEGALLLVDATQGVQAQTLSNLYLALEHDLEIIPVINKIDMKNAMVDSVKMQIEHELGLDSEQVICISAKEGTGIDALMIAIVERISPPSGDIEGEVQARIFDSHYDSYRGVIIHLRVVNGALSAGQQIRACSTGNSYKVEEVGQFEYSLAPIECLSAGMVGYLIAGIKNISDVTVGDTITDHLRPCAESLQGFRPIKPVVFSAIYPVDSNDYQELTRSIEKLQINDAALSYEKTSSSSLGYGFRCGFLGLLHLEVTQERLEREHDLSVILTVPTVVYDIALKNGEELKIRTPQDLPPSADIEAIREPYIRAAIIVPQEYMGNIMTLCIQKRGSQISLQYLDERRVELIYEMPLAEILFEFYDQLKSFSRGYASFDYDILDTREVDLSRLDILINGKPVDALSQLIYTPHAQVHARRICRKLRDEIPRHQFKIPIQGAIGSQIIARETISAYRKDVIAKCYGGDITRKRKLLEKQRSGKKRLKMVGNVELPQSAFLAVLKSDEM